MSPEPTKTKRTVCDHCRRRRIRCDGNLPCNQCQNTSLICKREHIPKRRGPKKGSGRVINELRAQDGVAAYQKPKDTPPSRLNTNESVPESHSTGPGSSDDWISDSATAPSSPSFQRQWLPAALAENLHLNEEPRSIFTSEQFMPTTASYFHLIPTCIDLFMEHIYPIMPLIYMPALRESIKRQLDVSEKNLVYSLCALTSTHMIGKSISAPGPQSWETAGRFFLDQCILVRQSYDFVEDKTLSAVISCYFLSTAFFELNQSRKSWYYLREALTMGQDLGFHDEKTYIGLSPAEELCRRRTFWILYVTERSFAILRHKPLTLSKTPALPITLHEYETPEIHSGFMHLVQSYHLLDSNFVDSWNESSEAPASTLTYTALQEQLSLSQPSQLAMTDIQKADILVTQQWLRLIVWQSSMRQGLLSWNAEDESMTFRYPLKIAHSLLEVISSLPIKSIEVHGMGIFEKIFEIGNAMVDIMQVLGTNIPHEFYGVSQDPFVVFVKTLSQTPNSQKHYANLLLAKAAEKPEMRRFSNGLMPSLSDPTMIPPCNMDFSDTISFMNADGLSSPQVRQWRGSIVGEVGDDGIYEPEVGRENQEGQAWCTEDIGIPESLGLSDAWM
ncbi:hypothetical protein B0O99DRAFT_293453 [Bisporella sp. PMI_857]|nr:hypothetical protein B0O99DRAFT_293453 [Bisporella sp. PMI_857]